MGMSRTEEWRGHVLTKGDLLELLGAISTAPDETPIKVEKTPVAYDDHPSAPGGEIILTVKMPREQVIQKD